MANTIITSSVVTRECLRILHNKLNFIGSITRDYDSQFAVSGAKIGSSLNIRMPNQYTVRTGPNLTPQDTVETTIPLQITSQRGVDMNFTAVDLTLSLDDFSRRIIEPAMNVLAAYMEADALSMVLDVYNMIGTTGVSPVQVSPNELKSFTDARALLNKFLTPKDNRRKMLINSDLSSGVVNSLKGLFHDSSQISKQYLEGMMGRAVGFDWLENDMLPSLTNGTITGATVSGAGQSGSTLTIASAAGLSIKKGQVFTIAGVFQINPETKNTYGGKLQQFVVTQDVASTGTTTVINISPAIVTTGAKQNVSAGPAASANITFNGAVNASGTQHVAFHPEAFCLATADLVMPKNMDWSAREVFDGISIRLIRGYDINTDQFPCRLDVLYGYKTLRPSFAVRIGDQ